MYVYVLLDKRGVVKDFEKTDDESATWQMKFYDDKETNVELEKQGYIKTFLTSSWFKTFETYYDLFTFDSNALRLPTNVPSISNDELQSQIINQDEKINNLTANNQTIIKQNSEIVQLLKNKLVNREEITK
ncbi:hypothetical protein [Companilactobacillus nodensis]|uniref:Uncharacterized protein n=1 Tax=Companilactobacillus nodensis DSM 19682 = JCM 14932 = NBRC 107160 TaxID=1423775 RepID=A0A0R1K727_9LACO|nr:hypothetical protein [Companilactobacillus nodensis]KRK79446.1 hypothetical protein FD03_GL000575 [Companilactobacillus nodensis DSM 19682 = JCM 14932 = NBRC 107160]